ncbi:MAG: PDZ domain-containing protein, partial [Pseudomonadota bacterium]
TVTSGIISAQARTNSGGQTFLQTDAAINPGNSGGALVDMAGRLVGVNSAILTRSGGSNGVGFAIPASLVRQAVAQAAGGAARLRRPWLGAEGDAVDFEIARSLGLERPQGVILTKLSRKSPLAAAGLKPGDVVLSVDGAPIADFSGLEFRLAALGIGERATLEILTRRDRESVEIALIAAPDDPPRDSRSFPPRSALGGVAVANLNPAVAEELGFGGVDLDGGRVVVTGLDRRAARTGLRRGDLILVYNGAEIERVSDLSAAIEERPRLISLIIERAGRVIRFERR